MSDDNHDDARPVWTHDYSRRLTDDDINAVFGTLWPKRNRHELLLTARAHLEAEARKSADAHATTTMLNPNNRRSS